jgi:hypothetical protein
MKKDIERSIVQLTKFKNKEVKLNQTEFFGMFKSVQSVVNPYLFVRNKEPIELKFAPSVKAAKIKTPV